MSKDNSNIHRVEHIKSELKLCFTFAVIAASKYDTGEIEGAERSLSRAEEILAGIVPLVLDPKLSKDLSNEHIQEFSAELKLLRQRLDRLRPLRK